MNKNFYTETAPTPKQKPPKLTENRKKKNQNDDIIQNEQTATSIELTARRENKYFVRTVEGFVVFCIGC